MEENIQTDTITDSISNIIMNDPLDNDLIILRNAVIEIKSEINKVIIGQENAIDMLLISILTGGHVLLEGVPGIAKTLMAKMIAKTISAQFSRIQFTPDLMPTDITGTSVFNFKTSEFVFNKGPIFTNLVLIDEINRAPAKTQSALFEVMEEKQITIDGNTYVLDFPFLAIATQNPIEQEGTYRLPEAQLDRFLFRVKMEYPNLEEEIQILHRFKGDFDQKTTKAVNSVLSVENLRKYRTIVENVFIKDELLTYIAQIVDTTRRNKDIFLGASPRASINMMKSAKACAAINGRKFVTPEDIQQMATAVLNHRLILNAEVELEGISVEEVITEVINSIEIPR